MVVRLTHPFIRRCVDPEALLSKCSKFNTFASRLEKQAKKYAEGPDDGWIRAPDEELENQYKGDGFELFGEAFIRVFGTDRTIGIDPASYEIIKEGEDRGVDGSGIGLNGNVHTVQFKYRQADCELSTNANQLGNFKAASLGSPQTGGFGVNPTPDENGKCNMTIIHSGKKLGVTAAGFMLPEAREINRRDIRRKVDGNTHFWNTFRDSWKEVLEQDEAE